MSDPKDDDVEEAKARRRRNLMIGAILAAFVVLTFIVTIAKLSAHVAPRTF
ncbi:MAG TPA: hypothetical protein VG960_11425 [Caulobacteraceae bacterium]|nr:hypothetical protein [Caulobacteraceae bacterium]